MLSARLLMDAVLAFASGSAIKIYDDIADTGIAFPGKDHAQEALKAFSYMSFTLLSLKHTWLYIVYMALNAISIVYDPRAWDGPYEISGIAVGLLLSLYLVWPPAVPTKWDLIACAFGGVFIMDLVKDPDQAEVSEHKCVFRGWLALCCLFHVFAVNQFGLYSPDMVSIMLFNAGYLGTSAVSQFVQLCTAGKTPSQIVRSGFTTICNRWIGLPLPSPTSEEQTVLE
jgi:hypothetical protein